MGWRCKRILLGIVEREPKAAPTIQSTISHGAVLHFSRALLVLGTTRGQETSRRSAAIVQRKGKGRLAVALKGRCADDPFRLKRSGVGSFIRYEIYWNRSCGQKTCAFFDPRCISGSSFYPAGSCSNGNTQLPGANSDLLVPE